MKEKKFSFLDKKNPIERLKDLSSFNFLGNIRNDCVTTLSNSSKIIFSKDCIIGPYVTIEGTIYCENNVHIGPYSFLRGPLYLGENVKIGPYCEITRSIIMKNSIVAHKNIIPDAVIEENVWLSGGVILCNTKMNLKKIKFTWEKIVLETEKFSAYIETNAKLGVNTIVMPGTHIKENTTILGPCTINRKGEII